MNRPRNRSLTMEHLDSRQMMAGDVSVAVGGFTLQNTLNISEAPGHSGEATYLSISQLSNGNIRVDGRNAPGGGATLVNGQAFQDFNIPVGGMNINANLGGGNDYLRILPGTHLNDVALNLGGPGPDVDTVDLNGITTRGKLSISTGAGVDSVYLQNSNIGDGNGVDDVTIDTGLGIDYVMVGNTSYYQTIKGSMFINTSTAANEADIDRVTVQLTNVRDFLTVSTGGGDDVVAMTADFAGKDISLMTGDGVDTATLRDLAATNHIYMLMGNGNDVLDIQNLRSANIYADGGDGVDTLNHHVDGPADSTSYLSFDYINGVRVGFRPLAGIGTKTP